MSNVEKLEAKNRELLDLLKEDVNKKESRKTAFIVLISIITALVIILGFTYVYGPIFGDFKIDNSRVGELSSEINKLKSENLEYEYEVKNIKEELARKIKAESVSVYPDLIYRVQIGIHKTLKMGLYSEGLKGVLDKGNDGHNKYSLGIFDNYKDAVNFKLEVKRMGIKTAFLIAVYKGERINIKDALKLEKK